MRILLPALMGSLTTAILIACCSQPPEPPPLKDLIPAPVHAIQRVWQVLDPDNYTGTAFPFHATNKLTYFLTARHLAQDDHLQVHSGVFILSNEEGTHLHAKVLRVHPIHDAAILIAPSKEPIPLIKVSTNPLTLGDPVWTAGYQTRLFTLTGGYVSAPNRISAPLAPGGSGGPVFNREGQAVGITVRIRMEGDQMVYHIVFVVPLNSLRDWLPQPSPAPGQPASRRAR